MNFLTFLFAFAILMFFVSCYENSDFPAQDVYNGLKNTEWIVDYVKDQSGTETLNGFIVHFDKLNTINVFVDGLERNGSWAVYEGFNGGIIQIRYPNGSNDSLNLDGNWNIVSYDKNMMVLTKNNFEILLKIKK